MKVFYTCIIDPGSSNPLKENLYKETHALAEKLIAIYFGFVKIVCPFWIILFMASSYYKYYINDMGKDSFVLAFEAWYQHIATFYNFD